MEQEIMELKQGCDHFDETLFDNYKVLEKTHAAENALPITVWDLLGEIIDVQNSNHPSPTLALTPGQNSDSGPVIYWNSTQNSGTKNMCITLEEDDPKQAVALKQILQAVRLSNPDSTDENQLTWFHTTILNGNKERWFRKMVPVWFSHE